MPVDKGGRPDDDAAVEAVGAAIRLAHQEAGMTQEELGHAIGIDDVRQAQVYISRFERAQQPVPLEVLPKIDEAVGQTLGYVLRLAGFVVDSDRAEDVIASDGSLVIQAKKVVLQAYRSARRESDLARHSRSSSTKPEAKSAATPKKRRK